jgi:hypothetical protein
MDSGFANTYTVRPVSDAKDDGHFCSTSLRVRATTLAPTTIIMGRYHTPDSRAGPIVILPSEGCRSCKWRWDACRATGGFCEIHSDSHCADDEEGNGERGSSRD